MSLPFVCISSEDMGWAGGNSYIASIKSALGELQSHGLISILPPHELWLESRFPDRPKARKNNKLQVSRDLANVAFLPWAPVRRLPRPLIWIPDLQDVDMPEMFKTGEVKSRARNRKVAISRNAQFYFSSHTMERRFHEVYPTAITAGVVRFAFKATAVESTKNISEYLKVVDEFADGFFYAPNQFWKHKNHLTLLKAFAKYRRNGGTQNLVLSGGTTDPRWPDHRRVIEKMSSETDGVYCFGYIPREAQLVLYRDCSAVIQPSRYEGWSTSVEEALSFGKRIVSSDIQVLREQLADVDEVRFFEPEDSDGLAKVLFEIPILGFTRDSTVGDHRWDRFKSDLYKMIINYLP